MKFGSKAKRVDHNAIVIPDECGIRFPLPIRRGENESC